jgi:O-antigen/teichoic acid export membrane protein
MLSHLRNYASAGVVTGVVGLFSFPILTRNLSVAEYGIVGLITATLTLFIAFGKLGVQHSVIRFFAQIKHGNVDFSVNQLNSTVSVLFFCLASITTLLWLVSGLFVLPNIMQYEGMSSLFLLASGIVFIRLLGSGVINFLRAQQRSGDVAVIESLTRCLNLFFIVCLLLLSALNPWTVIGCFLMAEVVGVTYAFYCYSSDFHFRFEKISGALAKSMLFYGMPLMVLESLELVLLLSDRYMIESMIGASALGQYSASYNFATYIDLIILVAMVQALKPAYIQIWEAEGREATQVFLAKFLRVFLIAGIPFVTMFALTAPHLLGLLAGPKYAPGTVIIPYLAVSYLLLGSMHIFTAGLYIFKDTKALVIWSCIATVINIGLNLIFIPMYGITGAAMMTLLAIAVVTAGVSIRAFRYISFPLDLRIPLLMAVASVATFILLNPLTFGSNVLDFVSKGFIGSTVLLMVMWLVEPEVRFWIANRYQMLRGKEVTPD